MDTENVLQLNRHSVLIGRIVFFTALSGVADAMGFVYSARAWGTDAVYWDSLSKAGLCFAVGLVTYWIASRDLAALGVGTPEVQALFWFMMTVIGLALLSGRFLGWPLVDQAIAVAVVGGLCTLIFRVG